MSVAVPSLDSLDFKGKRVLMRCDFNVPQQDDGSISDDTRIRAALPTIQECLKRGASRVVLMSHLGRPKGVDDKLRLAVVGRRLAELLGRAVVQLAESTGPLVEAAVKNAPSGAVILLENVRFHPTETKGDPKLAAEYAKLGDVFVNDAFGTSHRDEASVSGVARLLPSAAGLLVAKEIEAFARVLHQPARPLVAILGGAKVSDKLPVIDNLLPKVDALLIGGGMAYTFLSAQGHTVGASLVQQDQLEAVKGYLAKAKQLGKSIHLPSDHVIAQKFEEHSPAKVCGVDIPAGWMGLDIGPATRDAYRKVIVGAKTVVWNGPMGVFEWGAFRAGTEAVGRAVADCTGYTVVGGGDSVAAVELLELGPRIRHISTGGGASLELLEGKALPGVTALAPRK
ncbi:MAG: phosphoglycerate kinase [Planctomycetes bacterium]|nr:phosphoglycerate kinase [Planctomycetota bacterium]